MSGTLGLYLHVPFCARRCDYCDFFVIPGRLEEAEGGPGDWLAWMRRELERETSGAGRSGREVESIYLGGGTPSYVPPEILAGLLDACRAALPVLPDAEITLEANPESVTARRAASWRLSGVNRLSLGAQSLSDEVLAPRGRLHDAAGVLAAARAARREGFDNLGVDLIAGLPGETAESFTGGIEQVMAMGPEHVSVYLLETGESGKRSALAQAVEQGRVVPCDEDEAAGMFVEADRRLSAAGWEHYEIANFARPGRASRHNLRYWRSDDYLGLGPSAHSCVDGRRWSNPASMDGWKAAIREGRPAGLEYTLAGPESRAREALVLELRLLRGVDPDRFARRWGWDPRRELAAFLAEMEEAGLLHRPGGRLALTRRGVLMSNDVFSRIA
ncbi:MAG TPA: radical SAM family heme chaperone HemW [Candidatus Polarisedimenticolia bacterium]|nr:radical SAM family heme chaperone HemW [Candidatus Polarisedimenticolia bacterium]